MNLELDLQFSSGKCLNLGLDNRFSSGLNLFEPVKFPAQFSAQKEGLGYFLKIQTTIPFVLKVFSDGLG